MPAVTGEQKGTPVETETQTRARRVRVTLEGVCHPVTTTTSDRQVVRIEYAPGVSALLFADAVTVEDATGPRSWTPGDVVVGDQLTYTRGERVWFAVTAWGTTFELDDVSMTEAVDGAYPDDKPLQVLRYQAGEAVPA